MQGYGGDKGMGRGEKGFLGRGDLGFGMILEGGGLRKFFSSHYPSARVEGLRVQRVQRKRLSVTVLNPLVEM